MFVWTLHRFSGGVLALDVANSVVLRFDERQRVDRYADLAALDSFAEAANHYCAERGQFEPLAPLQRDDRASFLVLRESIDRYFRARAMQNPARHLLADLLDAAAPVLRNDEAPTGKTRLDVATALSALRLSTQDEPERLKICPNCQWLFLDRSRNRSRTWCDMAVCGNRVKAGRHYHRRKGEQPS